MKQDKAVNSMVVHPDQIPAANPLAPGFVPQPISSEACYTTVFFNPRSPHCSSPFLIIGSYRCKRCKLDNITMTSVDIYSDDINGQVRSFTSPSHQQDLKKLTDSFKEYSAAGQANFSHTQQIFTKEKLVLHLVEWVLTQFD